MTPRFLLDADITIYLVTGAGPATDWLLRQSFQDVALSALALAQIEAGLREDRAAQAQALALLLRDIEVVPFLAEHARAYGALVRRIGYSRTHAFDHMIAAQALCLGAALVTNNRRDFVGVPGLVVEAWSDEAICAFSTKV